MGWLESVTPVNGELDVNRLGTSRLEVVEVIEVDRVGVVDFQLSSGLNMTGFYWEMGWLHQTRLKPQDGRFWRFWRWWVLGTVYKQVDSLGYWGGWW